MTETVHKQRDFASYKSRVAKSLHETLLNDCNPPPDELHIPYGLIVEDEDKPMSAFARVTYIVFCPGKKVHTVDINFSYDSFGRVVKDSMKYV